MSGSTLHDGLEYQALVTALAGVELVIVHGYAVELWIEPPGDDDLEAGIARVLEDDEPTPCESTAPTSTTSETYRLVVQSKRRDQGVWSAADVDRLLDHGVIRKTARQRLDDEPNVRYLLATSGMPVREAASLSVQSFGEWPALSEVDPRFAAYADGDRCRIGIMGALSELAIRYRLDELLRTSLKMPFDRVVDCMEALTDAARQRGGSRHSGVWTAEEIAATLRDHEAFLPGQLDASIYVEPLNYGLLQDTLATQQAVLIVGPSGTGKTVTAERLRDELHQKLNGARRSTLFRDQSQRLASEVRQVPAVIYIEDPWGPIAMEDGAGAWTKVLEAEILRRHAGAWLIITSRLDVFQSARVPADTFAPWLVHLDATQYGAVERGAMIDAGMKAMSFRLRALVEPFRNRAIETLSTPLEIRTYLSVVAQGAKPGETGGDLAGRARHDANSRRFQDHVAAQIRERKDAAAATVLWLLFLAQDTLTREDLLRARQAMTRTAPDRTPDLEGLVNFLSAGQSLDHVKDRYTYAHPQVEAGLAVAAGDHPATFESVGGVLIEALARGATGAGLGPMYAARILAGLAAAYPERGQALVGFISDDARTSIEQVVLNALSSQEGDAFRQAFKVAADIGAAGLLLFDLARWLTAKTLVPPDAEFGDHFSSWHEGPIAPEWPDAIAADPAARGFLEKFVEYVCAHEQEFYPGSLGERLTPLGIDLAAAFGRLASRRVGYGYDGNIDMVIDGALPGLAGLEPAVREAQAIYAGEIETPRDGWRLQLVNGVFDDDYTNHLENDDHGDNYCAWEITAAFVATKRQREGWRAVAAFPDVRLLIWNWIRAIDGDPSPPDRDEIVALTTVMFGDTREWAAWSWVAEHPELNAADLISARFAKNDLSLSTRGALRRAQAMHDLAATRADQAALLTSGYEERVLELHRDLTPTRHTAASPNLPDQLAALRADLPAGLAAVALAATESLEIIEPAADSLTFTAAQRIVSDDPNLAARLLRLTNGRHPAFDALYAAAIDGWTPYETDPARAALDTALAVGRLDLVRAGLSHPLGSVARRAIEHLATDLTVSELTALPGLDGYAVRRAVVEAIARHSGEEADMALLGFCADAESRDHSGSLHRDVARIAAKALTSRSALSDDVVRRTLLTRLAASSRDIRLRLAKFVAANKPTSLRLDVARALLSCPTDTDDAVRELISPELLLSAPAPIAACLTRLVGLSAPETQVVQLATRLSGDTDRLALVLLLARDDRPALNAHISDLLPSDHAARALTEPATALVARNLLHDLAEPAVARAVRELLADRFEPVLKIGLPSNTLPVLQATDAEKSVSS